MASGVLAARRPELVHVGRHDLIRWDSADGPRLTPLAGEPAGADRLLAGLVLHLSRCGSTLLAHLLAAGPGTCVLREPAAVNLVLGIRALSADARRSLLRRLVATGRTEGDPAAAIVLKGSSWNLLHADVLLAAFPLTPVVLVVRDPLEVLVSLVERPAAWLSSTNGSSREEQGAIAVATYLDAARRAVDHRWLIVHHEHLPTAASAVAAHFEVSPATDDRLAAIAAFDSKVPDRRWQDDGAAKRARASPALRRAHERHTQPAYERLLTAFARTAPGA